jgi:hypothetical protein
MEIKSAENIRRQPLRISEKTVITMSFVNSLAASSEDVISL